MSCKVEGCYRPIYHYNPLVSPLQKFHGKIVTLGSDLPRDGKATEVVKRIGYAIVSPFVYLALAFVALAGLLLNGIWENRHISEKNAEISNAYKTELGTEIQLPAGALGKTEWEKTFPVKIKEVPPLPSNINVILEQEDPCEPGKKLKETCQLFLRPQKVILKEDGGDKEITLGFDVVKELALMAKNPDRRKEINTSNKLRDQMNQMPVAESGWVLMRKQVIPGSRCENFETQKTLLKGGFVVPKLMDAVLLNILYFASEGEYLYGKEPCTFTRCQEKVVDCQTIVGGFGLSGLDVIIDHFDAEDRGLTGCWKF